MLKKPSGFDLANLGKTIKKNKLKSMFTVTLPILIMAYCIGLLVALNFEKGIIAKVSLATSDYYTNSKGEKIEETQWHNLVAYGKTAEIMQKYVDKGKEIGVEGKLIYRSYDGNDGQKHFITEIRVEELLLLSK